MMRSRRFAGFLVTAAAVLLLGIVAFVFAFPILTGELDKAAAIAQLLSIPFAAASLVGGLWVFSRRAVSNARLVTASQVAEGLQTLAFQVRRQWRIEMSSRAIGLPTDLINVSWTVTRRALMDGTAASGEITGHGEDVSRLVDDFLRLRRKRLVVLGGPGTGKTTLLARMLIDMVDREPRMDLPVPVIVPLSSWNRGGQSIRSWLVERVEIEHPALRSIAPGLVPAMLDNLQILPMLDGFDELQRDAQACVLNELNEAAYADYSFVLTSRTREFDEAVKSNTSLAGALVIKPRAVSGEEIRRYLDSCSTGRHTKAWQEVIAAMNGGRASALRAVCSVPLGLWLIRETFVRPGRDPAVLLTSSHLKSAANLRSALLADLVPQLIENAQNAAEPARYGHPRLRWNAHAVERWVKNLARALADQETREIEWWRFFGFTFGRWPVILSSAIVCGIVSAVGIYLLGSSHGRQSLPYEVLPALCMTLAVVAAGLGLLAANKGSRTVPGFASFHSPRRLLADDGRRYIRLCARRGLRLGLLIGLLPYTFYVVITTPYSALDPSNFFILVILVLAFAAQAAVAGGILGGVVGALDFVAKPTTSEANGNPLSSVRADRRLTLYRATVRGVASAAIACVVQLPQVVLSPEPLDWFLMVFICLAAGLIGLVTTLFSQPSGILFMVSPVLAVRKVGPMRMMSFLEYAREIGLLRTVGASYQFRHAEVQDYLASATCSDGAATRRHSALEASSDSSYTW